MTNPRSVRAIAKRDPLYAECLAWASSAYKGEPADIVVRNADAEYRRRSLPDTAMGR